MSRGEPGSSITHSILHTRGIVCELWLGVVLLLAGRTIDDLRSDGYPEKGAGSNLTKMVVRVHGEGNQGCPLRMCLGGE